MRIHRLKMVRRPLPGVSIRFSSDDHEVVFLGFATHADVERAKREKRKADEMPKGDLVVIHLETGAVDRAPRVASFQLTTRNSDYLAFLQVPEKPAPSRVRRNRRESETAR